jgi:hypothetical protein
MTTKSVRFFAFVLLVNQAEKFRQLIRILDIMAGLRDIINVSWFTCEKIKHSPCAISFLSYVVPMIAHIQLPIAKPYKGTLINIKVKMQVIARTAA